MEQAENMGCPRLLLHARRVTRPKSKEQPISKAHSLSRCALVSDWGRVVTKACCWTQVPMLLVYMCVHRFYTRSYIELQRIDAVSTASDHPDLPCIQAMPMCT